jgi:hypothetical protein
VPILLGCLDAHPHSLVIQAVFLGEVQNREVDVTFVFEVFDGKIEPLMVASRVGVDTHVK